MNVQFNRQLVERSPHDGRSQSDSAGIVTQVGGSSLNLDDSPSQPLCMVGLGTRSEPRARSRDPLCGDGMRPLARRYP